MAMVGTVRTNTLVMSVPNLIVDVARAAPERIAN
jgi:hypothetical protein